MKIKIELEIECTSINKKAAIKNLTRYFGKLLNLKSVNETEIKSVQVINASIIEGQS